MKSSLFTASLVAFSLLISAPTRGEEEMHCLNDECFPTSETVKGVGFKLVGVDLLRFWGFKVYTAALYLPPSFEDGDDPLAPDLARKLEFHYHRSISREDIVKAARKNLEQNPNVNERELRDRLERIYSWYNDVDEGDVYELVYVPEKGTSLYFNGDYVGTIEGADFAQAKFGLWLWEDYCLSDSLRENLLTPHNS